MKKYDIIAQSTKETLTFPTKEKATKFFHIGKGKLNKLIDSGIPFVFRDQAYYFDELYGEGEDVIENSGTS